ncbi:MAG: YggT family protein [Pseudomonadota bacterium]
MQSLLMIFNMVVNLVFWIIIIQAVLSWLVAFDVLNTRQPLVAQIWSTLNRITEPLYRPIRNMLPDMGGIDLSPIIVILGLYAIQIIVNNNLAPLAYG